MLEAEGLVGSPIASLEGSTRVNVATTYLLGAFKMIGAVDDTAESFDEAMDNLQKENDRDSDSAARVSPSHIINKGLSDDNTLERGCLDLPGLRAYREVARLCQNLELRNSITSLTEFDRGQRT